MRRRRRGISVGSREWKWKAGRNNKFREGEEQKFGRGREREGEVEEGEGGAANGREVPWAANPCWQVASGWQNARWQWKRRRERK